MTTAQRPTPPSLSPELEAYVVKQLSWGKEPSDIVYTICEQTGLDWHTAQKLVYSTAAHKHQSIARRQLPLLITVGLLGVAGGLLLLVMLALDITSAYRLIELTGAEGAVALALSQRQLAMFAFEGVTGLGLLTGGSYGLYRAVAAAA